MTPSRALLTVSLLTGLALPQALGSPEDKRLPNIVFVVSDDQSAPWLGAYGMPVQTPVLDRFATEGMLFETMWTAAPQCAPNRSALLTGRSPVRTGVARFSSPVRRDVRGFPEMLRERAGYYTGIVRRSHHLDGWHHPGTTLSREIWEEHNMGTTSGRFDHVHMGGNHTVTGAFVDEFLDKVPEGRPFFLWVNFNDPHHPWNAPRVHNGPDLPLPGGWPDIPELRDDLARYCDEVARLDSEFAQVLTVLEARGLSENTIVIFTSDNGMALPRGKGALHEPGVRVPLLIRWPGVIPPGTRSGTLISAEDFAPTFLDIAGLAPDPEMSGHSFGPLLRGEQFTPRTHLFAMRGPHGSSIYDETILSSGYDLGRTVRDARYKLIINYTPFMRYAPTDSALDPGWLAVLASREAGTLAEEFEKRFFSSPRPISEFYDLQKDPDELNNLAGDPEYADAERALRVALHRKMILDHDFLPLPLRE